MPFFQTDEPIVGVREMKINPNSNSAACNLQHETNASLDVKLVTRVVCCDPTQFDIIPLSIV